MVDVGGTPHRVADTPGLGNVDLARTTAAYTPVTKIDTGRDAIAGTADDQNIVVYNLLPQFLGVSNTKVTNSNSSISPLVRGS